MTYLNGWLINKLINSQFRRLVITCHRQLSWTSQHRCDGVPKHSGKLLGFCPTDCFCLHRRVERLLVAMHLYIQPIEIIPVLRLLAIAPNWCTEQMIAIQVLIQLIDLHLTRLWSMTFEKFQKYWPASELMKSNWLQRLPHVFLTCCAFFWWLLGPVITQHRTRTLSFNSRATVSSPALKSIRPSIQHFYYISKMVALFFNQLQQFKHVAREIQWNDNFQRNHSFIFSNAFVCQLFIHWQ